MSSSSATPRAYDSSMEPSPETKTRSIHTPTHAPSTTTTSTTPLATSTFPNSAPSATSTLSPTAFGSSSSSPLSASSLHPAHPSPSPSPSSRVPFASPYSPPSSYSQYHPHSLPTSASEPLPHAYAAIHPHPHPQPQSAYTPRHTHPSADPEAKAADHATLEGDEHDPFSSFARDLAHTMPGTGTGAGLTPDLSELGVEGASAGTGTGTGTGTSTAPMNPFVDAMLTDLYQITMCYAYWKNGTHEAESVFDLFFRKHPFNGEFTIFAGLEEVIRYISCFRFTKQNVQQLAKKFPEWEQSFWEYMLTINTSKVRIYAIDEGTIVIPRIPLIRVEGPLSICQLIETTVLVLVNYASLIATNAARHRLAAGPSRTLLEFGLRRAQGPDGAMSASRYAYIGGFDATSNVKAATMFGIAMSGTHAHSFVVSFTSVNDLKTPHILDTQGNKRDFVSLVQGYRSELDRTNTNNGELASFIAYAQCFPKAFLALVDTYDTLESGVWNFICVALALHQCGYTPKGIRLDSGDLAYLSKECRKIFIQISSRYNVDFARLTIVASNDLSEKVLWSLREQGHEIDSFGVGTNLVTCKTQPALGCVYKLVQINKASRIKISHDSQKVTIPGKKEAYRLFNAKGEPVVDLLISVGTTPPSPLNRILCRHPFDANKRVYVTPSRVQALHSCVWDGRLTRPFPSLHDIRLRVAQQLASFREDHLRRLNPTPYKLSVTSDLYTFMHDIWLAETPIAEIT